MTDDKPTGHCAVCGREFRLRKGVVWYHRGRELMPRIWPEPPCKGWGRQPAKKDTT